MKRSESMLRARAGGTLRRGASRRVEEVEGSLEAAAGQAGLGKVEVGGQQGLRDSELAGSREHSPTGLGGTCSAPFTAVSPVHGG